MADAVTIKLDTTGVYAELDALGAKVTAANRPVAQAAAQVFYDEVKLRAPVSTRVRKTKSGRTIQPGALKASIYQVFSQDNSNASVATYHVSWNAKKAPHGHLVEYGTSHSPAHPFVRPAFDTALASALAAAQQKLGETL